MKKTLFLLSVFLLQYPAYSQLRVEYNRPCAGDKLVKYQVEYKDPGRAGVNVFWDFSSLKLVNDKYRVAYSSPKMNKDSLYIMGGDTIPSREITDTSDLIIGTEHSTRYYFRIKDSLMYLLGHENSVSLIQNFVPIPVLRFSGAIGRKDSLSYSFRLLNSGTSRYFVRGKSDVVADATGFLILPDKDTLRHVTRVKETLYSGRLSDSLSSAAVYRKAVETCRWYAAGYRYPIFETVRGINLVDSTTTFATAFFYPPGEHDYLQKDDINVVLLDSLKKEDSMRKDLTSQDWISRNFSCNFYPNPVEGYLHIEYKLEACAPVGVTLYSPTKGIVSKINSTYKASGIYTETINCSTLSPGTYVLTFEVNGGSVGSVVIKK